MAKKGFYLLIDPKTGGIQLEGDGFTGNTCLKSANDINKLLGTTTKKQKMKTEKAVVARQVRV